MGIYIIYRIDNAKSLDILPQLKVFEALPAISAAAAAAAFDAAGI